MKVETLDQFKEQVDVELKKRFGIGINDVSEASVEACFVAAETPIECVDWIAEKYELTDHRTFL